MKKKDTKQKILEIGARLMHEKGFNDTGIQEVLKQSGIPKGSFYFYFKSKEDFGLQVLDCFFGHFKKSTEAYFNDPGFSHPERIKNFLCGFLDFFVHGDFKGGCPIGNFTLEMADVNPNFREKLREIMADSTQLIADQIRLGQEKGEILNLDNPFDLAEFIFFSWEGMIMQMKVDKNTNAMERFKHYIFDKFLQTNKA